jgi:glc operon protein GlcG
MPLTTEVAQRMIAASQQKARDLGVAVSTAIIDADGRLFAFARMDGSHWVSIEVAQAKAFTGALLRREGSDLQTLPAITVSALSAMYGRAVLPAGSVTTVIDNDRVVAGIGCSGATDEEDGECARAARDAYAG